MASMPDLENDAFFNTNEENDASMNAVIQITTATMSEELGTADPETAATAGKDDMPEIKAEPPSNTHVMGLEKDSEDGESPKKHDSDQQVSDEEKENQSKENSLPKRHSLDMVQDAGAPQAKRPKLVDEDGKDPENEVSADHANDVNRSQT